MSYALIRYAFIEFGDEDEAEKAKAELAAKNFNVFVDYVGEKSSKERMNLIILLTLDNIVLHRQRNIMLIILAPNSS